MPIKIEITANNEAELTAMIATLARLVPLEITQPPSKGGVRSQAQAVVSVEPMDMGDEAAPTDDEDDSDAKQEQAEPIEEKRGRGRPKGSTNKPKDDAPGAVDLNAMRDEAIKWAMEVFTMGAKQAEQVRDLTKKFNVRKLAEVPDDQVPALHAEAFKLKEATA